MSRQESVRIGGYVLAGGRSSRMGTDKALVRLSGKPLIAYATEKLGKLCANVGILSLNTKLDSFGRLVPDLHPGCGPLAGVEAALVDSSFDYNLLIAVDLPLIPTDLLQLWVTKVSKSTAGGVSYFEVAGRAQPGLLLIHRTLRAGISAALDRGEYKLIPALRAASGGAVQIERLGNEFEPWFTNVNTADDLRSAEELAQHDRPSCIIGVDSCRTESETAARTTHVKS